MKEDYLLFVFQSVSMADMKVSSLRFTINVQTFLKYRFHIHRNLFCGLVSNLVFYLGKEHDITHVRGSKALGKVSEQNA
jgi:hypothetical protein